MIHYVINNERLTVTLMDAKRLSFVRWWLSKVKRLCNGEKFHSIYNLSPLGALKVDC